MSRDLDLLHPEFRLMVDRWLAHCKAINLELVVTCTWRSPAEQAQLYAQGRTAPGKIVTNAKPGQSMHNVTLGGQPASLAIDVVPLRNGKPVWDNTDPIWQQVGAAGEQAGLEWAGRWKRFREFPHFQDPHAQALRDSQ